MPAFTDVIKDSNPSIKSNAFMKMAANINKKTLEAQSRELDDAIQYRERYEKLLKEISNFDQN